MYPTPNIYELTVAALVEKTGHVEVAYKDFTWEKEDFNEYLLHDDSDFYSIWTVNLSIETDMHAVARIHALRPEGYEVKEVLAVLDARPVLLPVQFRFWKWLSDYYLCTLGDVYKAALPSSQPSVSQDPRR